MNETRRAWLIVMILIVGYAFIAFVGSNATRARSAQVTFQCEQPAARKVSCAISCDDDATCSDLALLLMMLQIQNDHAQQAPQHTFQKREPAPETEL